MIIYYDIKDVKKIGRRITSDDINSFDWPMQIYEDKQWVRDTDDLIIDRLLGVEPSEPDDSPYKLGNSDVIATIEEIDEESVDKLIQKYYKIDAKEQLS